MDAARQRERDLVAIARLEEEAIVFRAECGNPGANRPSKSARPKIWYEAPSQAEARRRLEALKAGLGRRIPEAMKCLDEGFVAATRFYAFPREHWHRIRSTNALERLRGDQAPDQTVGAFPGPRQRAAARHECCAPGDAIWADRRYLDMSLLEPKEEKIDHAAEAAEKLHRKAPLQTNWDS